jgi:hypothetical protein
MMPPRYAELASELLYRGKGEGSSSVSHADRGDAIAAIERALKRKHRARILRRAAWAADAVMVTALGVGWLAWHHTPPPVAMQSERPAPVTVIGHPAGGGADVVDTGPPAPLSEGRSLSQGSRIVARSDGRALLSLSTGTRLMVEEGGDLTIVASGQNQMFSIGSGAVRADVAKLEVGQRFVIKTPDSEVEVHGTSFRVAIADADASCGGGTSTRVTAFEGVVSVRHGSIETRLTAGEQWPAGCSAPRWPAIAAHLRGNRRSAMGHAKATAQSARGLTEQPEPGSDLAEQNDSFARALATKRMGATREAALAFESFALRHPSSPLVESALAERMKLLSTFDREGARAAARQYLARYSKGFARAEAGAIEREGP